MSSSKHLMNHRSRTWPPLVVPALAAFLLGCGDTTPVGIDAGPSGLQGVASEAQGSAGPALDVGDGWSWNRVESLTLPPDVAQFFFGVTPEGPVTHVRCESSGSMVLDQTGATFAGEVTRTSITCETHGGVVFTPPPMAAPPVFPVVDGQIRGRAVEFVSVGAVICPLRGVITSTDGGAATGLSVRGNCIVPGHPQSPVPVDPPPGGTSKTILFEAVRW